MNKHYMEHFVMERGDRLLLLLRTYENKPEVKTMHEIRVELKKLRAVILFMKQHSAGDNTFSRVEKKWKKIFREAGSIRELQLHRKWLRKNGAPGFLQRVEKELQLKEMIFSEKIQSMILLFSKTLPEITGRLHKVKESVVRQYLVQILVSLRERHLLKNSDHWHEWRKISKNFLYATHWQNPVISAKIHSSSFYQRLDKLQELIGDWHDMVDLQNWVYGQQLFLSEQEMNRRHSRLQTAKIKRTQESRKAIVQKNIPVLGRIIVPVILKDKPKVSSSSTRSPNAVKY